MPWSRNTDWSVYHTIPVGLQEAYLQRLDMKKEVPTRAYLDALIRVHQIKIPFENLNVTDFCQPVSIEPQKMMDKILRGRRGGYCFELNGLFFLLLRSLGFDAWMCPCRQLRHPEPCPVPATHCGVLIYLDGKTLFCDVGYGGPVPPRSLEFKANMIQHVGTQMFRFCQSPIVPGDPQSRAAESGWYTLLRKSTEKSPETPLLQMAPLQFYLSDFYGQNLLRSCGDTAYILRHVARKTPDGFIDLTGDRLTIQHGAVKEEQTISQDELPEILLHFFDIDVKDCVPR